MSRAAEVAKPIRRRVLLVCDEWLPLHGGLSSFNRSLAVALAAEDFQVGCLVKRPSRQDIDDASEQSVQLFAAYVFPDGPDLKWKTAELEEFDPQIVIGHDHISGPAAWVLANSWFKAHLIHIVHTAPAELAGFKLGGRAYESAEERERLTRRIASGTDIVVGVGPRLHRSVTAILEDGFGRVDVHQMNPGLEVLPLDLEKRRKPPLSQSVLLVGRAADYDQKGLTVAARAVGQVPVSVADEPKLVVRGAKSEEADALARRLRDESGMSRHRVDVKLYTTEQGETKRDMMRASVLVMPSPVEGFGLVGWEAIAAGTPVLLSHASGLAQLLLDALGADAARMLVKTRDRVDDDVPRWSSAIRRVLNDQESAFQYAHDVRGRLAQSFTWKAAVAKLDERIQALNPRTGPVVMPTDVLRHGGSD